MKTFLYQSDDGMVTLEVRSGAEHIEKVLEDFKQFLHHVGYHADNVNAITYDRGEEHSGLQLDMFKDAESPL